MLRSFQAESVVRSLWDNRKGSDWVDISFIIPCKNDGRYLRRCLESIRRYLPIGKSCEVIVVDNESIDDSLHVAAECRVEVALSHGGSIGFGRNIGARVARAALLAFIDADVELTERWHTRATHRWPVWSQGRDSAVWGSWYSIRPDAGWVEKAWFEPLRYGHKTHMNGGHLLVRTADFWQVGGFPTALETGEDYEFSRRAMLCGLPVVNDEELEAIHLGYPRTVKAFFARELWHGRGDVSSVRAFVRSKTAVVSFAAIHAIPVGAVAAWVAASPQVLSAVFLMNLVIAAALVGRTFGLESCRFVPHKLILSLTYIAARGLAPYAVLSRFFVHKSQHIRRAEEL
jgi:GT2 family glycosyltransferase